MAGKSARQRAAERWIYEGPENGVVMPRNLRGINGRVRVKPSGEEFIIDLDGIRFQVPRGLLEELMAATTTAIRPYAGMSIFERIMDELDVIIDRLMSGDGQAVDGRDPGRAEAYTRALALIRNTYEPDYDGEKERAMLRWERRNPVEEG